MRIAQHDSDFYSWARQNAELLRNGLTEQADLAYIAEELEDMGKRERRSLESFIRNILMHLLKWRFQPKFRGVSWRLSIRNGRHEVSKIFQDSPSLSPILPDIIAKEYPIARENAADETGLPLEHFPESCPFSVEQILDAAYWPD